MTLHRPIDAARSLQIRAFVALVQSALEAAAPFSQPAALRLLSDLQAAGLATLTTLPDGRPALRLLGISAVTLGGAAPLLREWQAEALTALAREVRP